MFFGKDYKVEQRKFKLIHDSLKEHDRIYKYSFYFVIVVWMIDIFWLPLYTSPLDLFVLVMLVTRWGLTPLVFRKIQKVITFDSKKPSFKTSQDAARLCLNIMLVEELLMWLNPAVFILWSALYRVSG